MSTTSGGGGGSSDDDISIFCHASSLQHNTFLAKQNEIRINLGNGGSGKKTLISSDCLVWIRFFLLLLLRKTEWKITFSFRLSPMLADAIGHSRINGLKKANEFKIRYALLANMKETVSKTRCIAATNEIVIKFSYLFLFRASGHLNAIWDSSFFSSSFYFSYFIPLWP